MNFLLLREMVDNRLVDHVQRSCYRFTHEVVMAADGKPSMGWVYCWVEEGMKESDEYFCTSVYQIPLRNREFLTDHFEHSFLA